MRNFLGDFKKFILRGNVLDLAVAVVVGAAFNSVVQSFVNDVIMGFVGAIFGKPNFNDVVDRTSAHGRVVRIVPHRVVNFLIIGFAVFVASRRSRPAEPAQAAAEVEADPLTVDQELLTEIRDLLRERADELIRRARLARADDLVDEVGGHRVVVRVRDVKRPRPPVIERRSIA